MSWTDSHAATHRKVEIRGAPGFVVKTHATQFGGFLPSAPPSGKGVDREWEQVRLRTATSAPLILFVSSSDEQVAESPEMAMGTDFAAFASFVISAS